MRVTNIKTSTGLPSKLIITITSPRQQLLLLHLFWNTQSGLEHVNNPATTKALKNNELPFSIDEVKDLFDSVYLAL